MRIAYNKEPLKIGNPKRSNEVETLTTKLRFRRTSVNVRLLSEKREKE